MTGAGGSIGSEITLQVCSFQPEKVILFDIDETELHNMKLKLERMFPALFLRQSEGVGGNGSMGVGIECGEEGKKSSGFANTK